MTPAGFPHSDIHGSMPACGSPWLFAAYHVFLRRPVPWHPPCALSNLIVTKLSSCQRFSLIRFSPETNCKIVAFLRYALTYIIASQLVSLQDVFHLAVQFSKYIRFHISAIPENDTGSRRRTVSRPSCDGFFFISAFRLPHSFLCIDLE